MRLTQTLCSFNAVQALQATKAALVITLPLTH
jgi:hypothetical protein